MAKELESGTRIVCTDNREWGEWFIKGLYDRDYTIYEIARCSRPSDGRVLGQSEFDKFWEVV